MNPISLPAAMVRCIIPGFDGPTAGLLAGARIMALDPHSAVNRQVYSRLFCVAAVGTAALELLVHATLFVATIPLITVKRAVWITLISCSYVAGGLFGLIHGDAFRLGWEVWIKRIAIHVGLFLRHPSVVWDHLMVWRGLMWKHSVLIVQLTSLALHIERSLSHFFSSRHLEYHAHQSIQLLRYTIGGIPAGLWDPGKTAKRAMELGLGPTRPRSLVMRVWRQIPSPYPAVGWIVAKSLVAVGKHWDKIGVLLVAYAAFKDYRGFLSFPLYVAELPVRVLDATLSGLQKVMGDVWRVISPRHITPEDLDRLIAALEKR